MTAVISRSKSIQTLSDDTLSNVLSFLEPMQVAQTERVCKLWKSVIGSEDQHVWMEFCLMQKIPVIPAGLIKAELEQSDLAVHSSLSGKFTSQILEHIVAYSLEPKQKMQPLCARLEFHERESNWWAINDLSKGRITGCCYWGNEQIEPFIEIRERNRTENENPNWDDLPVYLPLRLFMKKDGSYKNSGAKVRLVIGNTRIVLTCTNQPRFCDGIYMDSLPKTLARKVELSLANGIMSNEALHLSKELAKTAPYWVDADQRER